MKQSGILGLQVEGRSALFRAPLTFPRLLYIRPGLARNLRVDSTAWGALVMFSSPARGQLYDLIVHSFQIRMLLDLGALRALISQNYASYDIRLKVHSAARGSLGVQGRESFSIPYAF